MLVLAEHPAAACGQAMRAAIEALAGRLEGAGARVARQSDLLPDLQALSTDYVAFVNTALSVHQPGASTPMNAHDWIRLVGRRDALRLQWRALFTEFDVLLCPPFGCAAFAHLNSDDWEARQLQIDGQATPFGAQGAWSTMASFAGLPATVAPLARDADGLPLGVQIIGPWLEDRTTIALARLLATA